MDDFARLSTNDRRSYFESAAANAGNMSEYIIEKDFWVCWTLRCLFSSPLLNEHLIFKGGTSLSKVFGVIERFSEDIDLSLAKSLLGFGVDKDPERASSSKQRNKLIEELAHACTRFVLEKLQPELADIISSHLGRKAVWHLKIDDSDPDGQSLIFEYPVSTISKMSYVKQAVKIELGARSDHWPAHSHVVLPYVEEIIPGTIASPKTQIITLDAARTFWEKATILHSYAHYPEGKVLAERQSRHYYDMFKLLHSKYNQEAVSDLALLARVAQHKSIYFRAGWAKYDQAKKGTLKLVPSAVLQNALRRDYDDMQEMIFGQVPSWNEVASALSEFELEFNKI